jgi:hypothetical protein
LRLFALDILATAFEAGTTFAGTCAAGRFPFGTDFDTRFDFLLGLGRAAPDTVLNVFRILTGPVHTKCNTIGPVRRATARKLLCEAAIETLVYAGRVTLIVFKAAVLDMAVGIALVRYIPSIAALSKTICTGVCGLTGVDHRPIGGRCHQGKSTDQ